MLVVLRIIVTAILLWSVIGLALWVWLPGRWRAVMLPALHLIGVMTISVGLHITGLFTGSGVGIWFLIAAAATAVIIRSRSTPWWRDLREWRWPVATLVAGLAVAVVLLSPMVTIGAQLIEPAGSNDGYAYSTSAEWIANHDLLTRPATSDPAVWGYVDAVNAIGLRLGQDANQAAVAQLSGVEAKDSWYIVMALWVMLIPGGMLAAARLLGLGAITGLVAGLLASASAVVLGQALFSNAAVLLGIAMTPLTIALVTGYIRQAGVSVECPPLWLIAVAAAALVCTYTEALPLVLPGALGYALHLSRGHVVRMATTVAKLGGAIIAVSPLGCFRAVKSISAELAGLDSSGGLLSPFRDQPYPVIASHLAGTRAVFDATGTPWSYVVIAFLGVGLLLSVLVSPARRFFGWYLGSAALMISLLTFGSHAGYGQGRAITVLMSLFMLAVAAGWATAFRQARRWVVRPLPRLALGTSALLAVAGFVAVNVSTVLPYLVIGPGHYVSQLLYTPEYDAAGRWLQRVAAPDGAQAMVVETGIHDQLWLRYRLRGLTAVQYPYLIPLYTDRTPDLVPSITPRYVVAQREAWLDADPPVVASEDAEFRHLDLSAGSLVLAAGAKGFQPIGDNGRGGPVQWMADDGQLLVIHDPSVHRIALTATPPPGRPPVQVAVSASGLPDQHFTVDGSGPVLLSLPAASVAFLTLHNERAATKVPQLPWPVSLAVTNVARA